MAPLTQTAFRLAEEDIQILDAIKREMGFAARSDALRYALRQYARQHGLTVGKKPKRRSKPK
jgi:metal-responsive CopG/Arc/MetJ family transcriptional regulator